MIDIQLIHDVREKVETILSSDTSGHGMDHIDRVYRLSMKFATTISEADPTIVALSALLHDVDDYKLAGKEAAEKLTNTRAILGECGVDKDICKSVIENVSTMGYSKALRGIRSSSIEGKIISDADMCDGIGAIGVLRSYHFAISDKGSGRIFDRDVWPNVDIGVDEYNGGGTGAMHSTNGFINHFFEKMLKLESMMFTKPGKQEALRRHEFIVHFLRQYFDEQEAPEWGDFLDDFLVKRQTLATPHTN